jgi:S1-C subfamily serine protease
MRKIRIGILTLILGGLVAYIGSNLIVKADSHLPKVFETQADGGQYASTVRLISKDGYFFCSGSVIDGNYVLTAAHCVTNFGKMSKDPIILEDINGVETDVIVVPAAIDQLRDVAFLSGDLSNFKTAPVDFHGDDVTNGMMMRTCGFPSGEKLWCTDLKHVGNYYFQYRTHGGPIFKGQSGGPVINIQTGRIIGVNSAVSADSVIISPLVGVLTNVGLE